jgi:uncharacterized protein YsxB (DUF464 family)
MVRLLQLKKQLKLLMQKPQLPLKNQNGPGNPQLLLNRPSLMVKIIFNRDDLKRYNGFQCIGHAEFKKKGYDIVCAGISTLTQTTLMALEKFLKIGIRVKADQKAGLLECAWENDPATVEQSDLLVETMKLGLNEIHNLYPEHLSLSEAEVLK